MSIKPWDKYQPNALIPSPQYPYGALRQETDLGVGNGTPLDVDWGNDFEAFKQTAFSRSGLTPSGISDTVTNSEMFNAMQDTISRNIWDKLAKEVGYSIVAGSFEDGANLTSELQLVWYKTENTLYQWKGTLNKAIPVNSTPTSTGGISPTTWVSFNLTLADELSSISGWSKIGQATYSQIRAYTGSATRIYCLGRSTVFDKAFGEFVVDLSDTTSSDNDGTVLVDVLGRRWKRQFKGALSMYWWGADPDGVNDASPAFQLATITDGSNSILIDAVYKITTPVEVTKRLVFHEGGKIVIVNGIVFRLNKRPDADPQQWIFDGSPSSNIMWRDAYVDWFGASSYGLGTSAQRAINVTNNILLNAIDYTQGLAPIIIPQARALSIRGKGFRQTRIALPSGQVCLNYQRTASQSPSSLLVEGIEFIETTAAKTSISILWWGYSAGTPGSETAINDDNWLRVKRCVFTGVGKGTHTKFAGQCHFEENMSLYSGTMHFKERGSSFHYHAREMCLAGQFVNGTYIYGDDPVNDAYSNGLFIDSCNSVTGAGIDMRLKNWQAVFIDKSGWDLGSAGPAALWFQLCQDVQIDSCWVASTGAAAIANRYGIHLDSCRNSNISKCTIVNNKRGISGLSSNSIGVSDTTFEGNLEYDIADSGSSLGWAIHGTRHRNTVSSGTPIWLNALGSGSHTVVGVIMKQATHGIPLGINSQTSANVFGAGLS